MKIGQYTFDEFVEAVKRFHASVAPGIIAGGVMVDVARKYLKEGELYDVICETSHCLPDAVQLLTPCTIGNRWLKIVDTSRFSLTFYNKYTGEGVRVYLDAARLGPWPAIRSWFLKERPKEDQRLDMVLEELKQAQDTIYATQRVKVKREFLVHARRKKSPVVLCPSCKEAYRADLGPVCPACSGSSPYEKT